MKNYKILPLLFTGMVILLLFAAQTPMMFAAMVEGGGGGTPPAYPKVEGSSWITKKGRYDGKYNSWEPHEVTATGSNSHAVISVEACLEAYSYGSNYDILRCRFTTYYKSKLGNPKYPRREGIVDFIGIEVREVNSPSRMKIAWQHEVKQDQWAWPHCLINSYSYEYAYRTLGNTFIETTVRAGVTAGLALYGAPGLATAIIAAIASKTVAAALYTSPIYGDSGFETGTTKAKYAFQNGYPCNTFKYYDGAYRYIIEASGTHYAHINLKHNIPTGTIVKARAYTHYWHPTGDMDRLTIYSNWVYLKLA